jgi:hypothetical protein
LVGDTARALFISVSSQNYRARPIACRKTAKTGYNMTENKALSRPPANHPFGMKPVLNKYARRKAAGILGCPSRVTRTPEFHEISRETQLNRA